MSNQPTSDVGTGGFVTSMNNIPVESDSSKRQENLIKVHSFDVYMENTIEKLNSKFNQNKQDCEVSTQCSQTNSVSPKDTPDFASDNSSKEEEAFPRKFTSDSNTELEASMRCFIRNKDDTTSWDEAATKIFPRDKENNFRRLSSFAHIDADKAEKIELESALLAQGTDDFASISSLSINSSDLDDLAISENYDDITMSDYPTINVLPFGESNTNLYKRSTEEFLRDLQLGDLDLSSSPTFDQDNSTNESSSDGLGNLANYCKKFIKSF